jgi:hypothetical protein
MKLVKEVTVLGQHHLKTCRDFRMRQNRSVFYREEQTGGERRSEMKDEGRTPSAPMAEHLSLRPPSP